MSCRCTTDDVDEKTLDFTTRCLFRIADEKGHYRVGEPLLFGSIVRLIHVPSDCTGKYTLNALLTSSLIWFMFTILVS